MNAPVVLFTYARPEHTRQTVEALRRNPLAPTSDLIVYSDAPCTPAHRSTVDDVREYLRTITGFRSVTIRHRNTNFGLSKSIIEGVTEVLGTTDRIIVLEDDMVTSPHFLSYMQEALERYAEDERVISVHGYSYPTGKPLPEAFFLPGADCWGWATWRRGWSLFNSDGKMLLDDLVRRKMVRDFDFEGTYPYSGMLQKQIRGNNDSWAIRWYASAYLAGKLTLYPGRSLVHNIGNDRSGTHCEASQKHDVILSETPIELNHAIVEPSAIGRQAFIDFFRKNQGGWIRRMVRRISRFMKIDR